MKAYLQEAEIPFRKTHDLGELLDSAVVLKPEWEDMRESLNALSSFAFEYRYPGEDADKDDATEALEQCRKIREIVRLALDPSSNPPANPSSV